MYKGMTITDIHTHVLPGLDDGPENLEESLNLLKHMSESGVDRVICTSHYKSPHFDVSQEAMDTKYQVVMETTTTERDLAHFPNLSLGAEVRISNQIVGDIQHNTIPTLGNTRYVLVELSGTEKPENAMRFFHELRVRNHQLILAHPERIVALQRNSDLAEELYALGVLFQLTANCFLKAGKSEHPAQSLAWSWLESGMAALIASDSHNTHSRPPVLVQAYERIAERCGDTVVQQLIANANAIWDGTETTPIEATKTKKRFLGWLSMRR